MSSAGASLVKTWPCNQGTVNLYTAENRSFKAYVHESGRVIELGSEWIQGLPSPAIGEAFGRLRSYFADTYVTLRPLSPSGYQMGIQHRLQGGMFGHREATREAAEEARAARVLLPLPESLSAREEAARRIFFAQESFQPPTLTQRMEERRDRKFKILSIDGGGIRGILPLKVLAKMEGIMGPLHETFDLIGGTSTGGIITLGLTTPFQRDPARVTRVRDILELYENHSDQIFVKNPKQIDLLVSMGKLVSRVIGQEESLANLLIDTPIYSGNGISRVAAEYMGEGLMKDARTHVFVTAVDVTNPQRPVPKFFKSAEREDAFLAMRDVACATSAAPMFFPQTTINGRKYIDGGVCNNTPALECHRYAEQAGVRAQDQYVVSLGTGFSDVHGIAENRHNLLYWAKNIYPLIANAQANHIDEQLNQALRDRYWSITPHTHQEVVLDDHSPETLDLLKTRGDELAEAYEDRIREIVRTLRPDRL